MTTESVVTPALLGKKQVVINLPRFSQVEILPVKFAVTFWGFWVKGMLIFDSFLGLLKGFQRSATWGNSSTCSAVAVRWLRPQKKETGRFRRKDGHALPPHWLGTPFLLQFSPRSCVSKTLGMWARNLCGFWNRFPL